jgi:DNA-binding GntR family transcriptional regulator
MTSAESILSDLNRRRQQLPDEVASYVRELIVSGGVKPGEFLRMEPIAEAVGVSNTPVREGLLSLSSEGYVRLVPRRGFVVTPFSPQDVRDLFWAQAQLAGELAARAAMVVTAEELKRLEELVDLHEDAVDGGGDTERIAALGHAFHRDVNHAARSERLALLLGSLVKHLPRRFYAEIEGQVQACRTEHPAILEALNMRQAGRARNSMQQHILARAEVLVDMLEQRGVWSDSKSSAD